jgi:hypothetical protein
MKTRLSNYFIVFFLVALAFVVNAQEQEVQSEPKQKDLKISLLTNPVSYLIDLISFGADDDADTYIFFMDLEFQYAINEHFTISVNPSIFASGTNAHQQIEKIFQFTVIPGLLYHPLRTGLKGWYIGLYPNFGFREIKSTETSYRYYYDGSGNYEIIKSDESDDYITEIGVNLGSGYKWIFKNGFTMEAGGTLGKTWQISSQDDHHGDTVNINSDLRLSLAQFDLKINFKIGYSF